MSRFRIWLSLPGLMVLGSIFLFSCTTARKSAAPVLGGTLQDSIFTHAHLGFALYDPATGRMLQEYQSDKYFIPASNVKIISCFAGMQSLGPRINGLEWIDLDTALLLFPTGDPTLLHPDFARQPVADFIRASGKPLYVSTQDWSAEPWGSGWSWDDYSEDYMAERSALPVFGNIIRWYQSSSRKENPSTTADTLDVFVYSDPDIDWPVEFAPPQPAAGFQVTRSMRENRFTVREGREAEAQRDVPFITHGVASALKLLRDSLHADLRAIDPQQASQLSAGRKRNILYSQPLDSMLRPMMHRSDNFYAEQTLLMAGYARNGKLDDRQAINQQLTTTLKGIPHAPRWADGSGLSRYNLFTPADFTWVLDQMQRTYGMERLQVLFPGSGSGTLSSFLADRPGHVYAKTGTLSGVVALSGYVRVRSGKWLIFSILVNNHRVTARAVRQQMEKILRQVIDQY